MFRKSSLIAFATVAAFGAALLTPVAASAKGGFHGGGGGFKGGYHGGGFKGGFHGGGFRNPGRFVHPRFPGRPHWHVRYRRPIWYAAPIVAPVATYAVARPAAGPCTCLSKQYTQEGAVVFKDNCTNEMAMNPPAQAPQQTGAIQQEQPQTAYVPQYQPQPQAR
jgi:hypothetical protein